MVQGASKVKTNRIEWLDLLRGLAALAIVAFHFHTFLGASHTGYLFVAVDLFFALSGVVLALKYSQAIVDGMGPLEFAGVRLRRLYPMVSIAGLFIVVLNLAGVPAGTHMAAQTTDAWTVLFVTPLPASAGAAAFPPDPPMWSFWAELAANAVWFLVLKAGRRWMLPLGLVSMAITVGLALWMRTLNFGWEGGVVYRLAALARALAWFSVGYAIALRPGNLKQATAIFAACLGMLVVSARIGHNAGLNELLGASAAVALLNVFYRLPVPPPAVGNVARLLGVLSFPLYLIHAPAGRLLPYFDRLPSWLALSLVVGAAALIATVANEALVAFVNRVYRRGAAVAQA